MTSKIFLLLSAPVFLFGCSVSTASTETEADNTKYLVCVEEASCKQQLAESCPKGGILHTAIPAIVLEYSCQP